MRLVPLVLAGFSALALAGCGEKAEEPAKTEGTPAAASAPMQGAPGAAGQSYNANGMPESVRQQLQQKGAPIK